MTSEEQQRVAGVQRDGEHDDLDEDVELQRNIDGAEHNGQDAPEDENHEDNVHAEEVEQHRREDGANNHGGVHDAEEDEDAAPRA